MSESHSTAPAPSNKPNEKPPDTRADTRPAKPEKPRPDFPLFPHATGRWAKKIRGKLHYFGPWDDPQGALDKYLDEKEDLHAGRTPAKEVEAVTVKLAANKWIKGKNDKLVSAELSPLTYKKYEDIARIVIKAFGVRRLVADLRADDFAKLRAKLTARWGVHRVRDYIQHVRSIFKHALESGLIMSPVVFGPGFAKPSRKTLRLHRAAQGPKLFTRDEVRAMLADATVPMRAMILLGINAGLGNADVSKLPLSAVNLATGWLDFPRPKTGIERRCWLWPETVAAIRAALAKRPAPKDKADAGLLFITKYGEAWVKDTLDNPVSKEFAKLVRGIKKTLKELGFYTLRHVFRTIADAAKDQPAVDFIMGHARDDMASQYREGIDDERLQAVAEHVRVWLYAKPAAQSTEVPTRLPEAI
jgi:integrase